MDECFWMILLRNVIRNHRCLLTGYFLKSDPVGAVGLTMLIVPGVPGVLKSHEHRPHCKFGLAMSAVFLPKLPRTAARISTVIV